MRRFIQERNNVTKMLLQLRSRNPSRHKTVDLSLALVSVMKYRVSMKQGFVNVGARDIE